ncbi:glycosyl hydrolase, partial [Xanthomonas sp. Kuri4-1]
RAAKAADAAVVFATQWSAESVDLPDMALPDRQDALIAAVAAANPHTTVVLETNGPVRMPWLSKVPAVLQAWYPGIGGGPAIAALLTGAANPSGHLPVTWPVDESQLPRPSFPGLGFKPAQPGEDTVDYDIEGANVGYKWFATRGLKPQYAFGHGLSYTTFGFDGLKVVAEGTGLRATFQVTNTGPREGAAVPQLYVRLPQGHATPIRLVGWQKLALKPGERREVTVVAEPKTLADFDPKTRQWKIAAGRYQVQLARSADDPVQTAEVVLGAATLP